jgi:uncharacterized protein YndB with AHSA1/START domain
MTSFGPRVEVSVIIDAAPERVFDAWLTPARLSSFLCAGDTRVTAIDVDPRVGGTFRVVMSSERGDFDHHGRYLEIDRPRRLRFTWISHNTDGRETEVTVTFEPTAGGTCVRLVHDGLDDQKARRHESGWRSILAKLVTTFLMPARISAVRYTALTRVEYSLLILAEAPACSVRGF